MKPILFLDGDLARVLPHAAYLLGEKTENVRKLLTVNFLSRQRIIYVGLKEQHKI
jgi:hypothetical protein